MIKLCIASTQRLKNSLRIQRSLRLAANHASTSVQPAWQRVSICTIAGSALGVLRPPMGQARRPAFKPNKLLSAIDQFRAVVAYVTRRHAKASFERTIEIGQISKARVICDRPD